VKQGDLSICSLYIGGAAHFLIAVVNPNTMHGWERKNQSTRYTEQGPEILEHEEQQSTCGSGPLLRMAGYSSPQVGYKLLV
jgi:hypothetical protein